MGVSLGCVAGLSATIAAEKWLHGAVAAAASWREGIYAAVFLASVVWAFVPGAPRGAVELLWLTVALTLAIPAGGLLGLALPSSGLWLRTDSLGV